MCSSGTPQALAGRNPCAGFGCLVLLPNVPITHAGSLAVRLCGALSCTGSQPVGAENPGALGFVIASHVLQTCRVSRGLARLPHMRCSIDRSDRRRNAGRLHTRRSTDTEYSCTYTASSAGFQIQSPPSLSESAGVASSIALEQRVRRAYHSLSALGDQQIPGPATDQRHLVRNYRILRLVSPYYEPQRPSAWMDHNTFVWINGISVAFVVARKQSLSHLTM